MSEEKASQVNKKSSHKHRRHRTHHAVLPYILTPIVFTLIALVVALPIGKIALNYAVNTVHKAQNSLSIGCNDISPVNELNADNNDISTAKYDVAELVGTLSCSEAGLKTDVYYGLNRVSLRSGAALAIADSGMIGGSDAVKIAGYSTTAFKSLYNVDVDDIITIETAYGAFSYKVYEVKKEANSTEKAGDLVLSTAVDSKPFSSYEDNQLYVYAAPIDEVVEQ